MVNVSKYKSELDGLLRENLSKNLKNLRKYKQLSQDALAKKAGLTTVGYGEIERGRSMPTLCSIVYIASVLNANLDEMFSFGEILRTIEDIKKY